jgi:GT2 family glycosyltransferase
MDENFEKGAHREEADFCIRCVKRGYRFLFAPAASLIHLAEPAGGIRSWRMNCGVHPLHHVTGEMYFIFKNVEFHYYPDYLACAIRRQILNPSNIRRPWKIAQAAGQMLRGSWRALRQLRRGPRYLDEFLCQVVPVK